MEEYLAMGDKPGRNDPCPCGSGKKFKQCCLDKVGGSGVKKKIQAVWVNKPAQAGVNLMERTFGTAVAEAESVGQPSFLTPPPAASKATAATEGEQPVQASEG
jgi:uncharacterized protein